MEQGFQEQYKCTIEQGAILKGIYHQKDINDSYEFTLTIENLDKLTLKFEGVMEYPKYNAMSKVRGSIFMKDEKINFFKWEEYEKIKGPLCLPVYYEIDLIPISSSGLDLEGKEGKAKVPVKGTENKFTMDCITK